MRFVYIDSRGNEVQLATVEALAARVQLGAITGDTRLYDSVADRWAPAEAHPVYRSVLREVAGESDGSGGPTERFTGRGPVPETPAPGERPPNSARSLLPSEAPMAHFAEPGTLQRVSTSRALPGEAPTERLEHTPDRPSTPHRPPTPSAPVEPDAIDLGLTLAPPDAPTRAPGRRSVAAPEAEAPPEPAAEGAVPGESGALAMPPGWAESDTVPAEWARITTPEAPRPRGETPRPDPVDLDPDPFPTVSREPDDRPDRQPTPGVRPGPAPAAAASRPRRRSVWDLVDSREGAIVLLVASFLVLVALGGAGRGVLGRLGVALGGEILLFGLATAALVRDVRNRFLIPVTTFAGAVGLSLVLLAFAPGEPDAVVETVVPEAPRPTVAPTAPVAIVAHDSLVSIAGGAAPLIAAAFQDMIGSMSRVATEMGLVDRPPRLWLEGIYLSHASQYPGVVSYFGSIRAYLAEIQSREESLYETAVSGQLALAGITGPDSIASLRAAMAGFRDRAEPRREVYARVREVAEASLYLHGLLVQREEDIDYEPFEQAGVSRDPVLEAVPNSPELRRELNRRIDRLTGALDRLDALEAPSTRRLQELLFNGIWATMLADVPPPLSDTARRD